MCELFLNKLKDECHRKSEPYIKVQVWITSCVVVGNILIGYILAWSAPVAEKLQNVALTPLPYALTEGEMAFVASVLTLGVIIGANVFGYLSNVIGRKRCIMAGGACMFMGYVFVTAGFNVYFLYVGRVVTGLGVGALLVNNVVYLGEIASTNIRGILVSATGVLHSVGCLLVYCIGPFVSYYAVGGILLALSTVFIAGCFTLPESPLFCMLKGQKDRAKDIMRTLGRSLDYDELIKIKKRLLEEEEDGDILEKNDVEEERHVNGNKDNERKWLELFTVKSNRKAFMITLTLFLVQHTGGGVAILFYTTTIFQKAASSVNPDIATIILGSTEVFANLVMSSNVERMGRKILIMISALGCSFCMTIMGVHFYLEHIKHPFVEYTRWLPLASLMFDVFFHNIGLNVLPNTIMGEMFSPRIRSVGSSVSVSTGLVFSLISGVTFSHMVAMFGGHFVFWLFAVINGFGFVFTWLFVPETKGKTLLEIEALMAK